jgi:hypothetical protein
MSDVQLSAEASELLGELEADVEVDTVALQRVRRRFEVGVPGVPLPPPRLLPLRSTRTLRQAWRSRAGIGAALLVGTAFGASGAALVSRVGSRAPVIESSVATARGSTPLAPLSVPAATPLSAPAAAGVPTPSISSQPPGAVSRGTPSARSGSAPLAVARAPQVVPPRLGLDAEMRALDAARVALRAGETERALEILRAHAAVHATSSLSQERDALLVRALVAAGQYAEAREVGRLFETRYAHSILLPSVERALASIP